MELTLGGLDGDGHVTGSDLSGFHLLLPLHLGDSTFHSLQFHLCLASVGVSVGLASFVGEQLRYTEGTLSGAWWDAAWSPWC